jgi:hypothetical protein
MTIIHWKNLKNDIRYFFLVSWGGSETESTWYVGHYLAYCTSPGRQTIGMSVKQSEWELAGESEVRGENLPQYLFVHHKPHMTWPGFEPGLPLTWDKFQPGRSSGGWFVMNDVELEHSSFFEFLLPAITPPLARTHLSPPPEECDSPTPNPQAGGLPLVGCPRLLIRYMGSYPPYQADHSPPTSAEVKKMWIYTSIPSYAFMA